MKKYVIFDMDGLLIDTEIIYEKAWVSIFSKYGVNDGLNTMIETRGMSDTTTRNYMNTKYNDDAFYDRYVTEADNQFWEIVKQDGVTIKEGAQELIDALHALDVKMALATSTQKMRADRLLEISGLRTYFSFRCYGNMVTHSKPHPEMYELVAKLTNVEKESLVILEDSINGVKSGNGANIDVIWIPEMTYDLEVEKSINVLAKYDSLSDAQGYILNLVSNM